MAVLRYAGVTLMVFAIIHAGVALALFSGSLLDIFEAGVFSGPFGWSMGMAAAFWFLIFSWPLFLLGYMTHWAYAKTGEIPVTILGGSHHRFPTHLGAVAVYRAGSTDPGLWTTVVESNREKNSIVEKREGEEQICVEDPA